MALNETEIANLLNREEIVFIATTKPNGDPNLVPVWFIVQDKVIYFQTHDKSQTYKNIENLNKIVLCFGGKETYIVRGQTKKYDYEKAPIPMKKLLEEKYTKDMKDSYVDDSTYVFEVIPAREISWHYSI